MLDFVTRNKTNLLLGLFLLAIAFIEARGQGDFHIFLEASGDLLNGENIYQNKYHDWYHYYYDVLFALVLYPLQAIPLYWANFIWLVLNLYFTYRIWQITVYYLPFELIKQKNLVLIIASVFIFGLWHRNIHLTQMTIFILFLCLEGIYQIENKRLIAGSLLIAAGISVKILPVILIPYLLYRAHYKATVLIVIFTTGVVLLPALIIGFDDLIFLLHERWLLLNPLKNEHVLDVSERSFHSLTTLLSVLLVEGAGNVHSLTLKRNIADIDLTTLKIVITVVRLVLIAGTLLFLRSLPFQRSNSKTQTWYELSYIFLIIPLIFPHQQHYAFFFAFPAIAYLVFFYNLRFRSTSQPFQKNTKVILIVIFGLLFLLLNSHFILGAYRNYYDHFKTLTYGILALIPFLLYAQPKKVGI